MSRDINQNVDPLFIFEMPDEHLLSETISVKGEKGERGDPTKLSDLENDEGFIGNTVDDLVNYYTKSQTYTKTEADTLLNAKANAADVPTKVSDLTNDSNYVANDITTLTGDGASVKLSGSTKAPLVFNRIKGDTDPSTGRVVTGDNTVNITGGKNKFGTKTGSTVNTVIFKLNDDGTYDINGTASANITFAVDVSPLLLENGATYTFWANQAIPSGVECRYGLYNNTSWVRHVMTSSSILTANQQSYTGTANITNGNRIVCQIYIPKNTVVALSHFGVQFEKGASATAFEAFNKETYNITLGDLELCKVTTYQDYIYTDGNNWYKHKEVAKIASYNGETITTDYISTTGSLSTGATVYYGVESSNEQITDSTLISQLDTLWQARGYDAVTVLIASATGSNMPMVLDLNQYPSHMPIATKNKLGNIIVGKGLSVSEGGILDADGYTNDEIDAKINTITNEQKGMWGISRSQFGYGSQSSDNAHYLMYSDDGISWQYVGKQISSLTSDASSVCEINGVYYYVGNNTYQYSTDMVNWSTSRKIINENNRPIWAAWFYYDEANDDIYCYINYQDPIDPNSTATNHKIVYLVGKQNADGSITFENTFHDLLDSDDESYIDASVIYDPVWGYLLACKVNATSLEDAVSGTVRIYEMTDLTTVGNLKMTLSGSGTEAPQLITDGQGNISVYVQDYSFLSSTNNKFGTSMPRPIPSTTCVIRLADKHSFATDAVNARILLKDPMSFRHIGVSYCTAKAYSLLKNIGIKPVTPMSNQYMSDNAGLTYIELEDDGGTYYIANHPNVVYIAGSPNSLRNITLIPVPAYDHEPFKIMLCKTKITWAGDSLPSWYGVKTLENTDTIFNYIEIMPLVSGTVRPPFNGTVS